MIKLIGKELFEITDDILNILLIDRTTRKNICWGTDHYTSHGAEYSPEKPITKDLILKNGKMLIKPRVLKNLDEKNQRTKNRAEVFTPSWICNKQNNLIDQEWFGRPEVFNHSVGTTWKTIKDTIEFSKKRTWKQYVDLKRLEITCGEAPYLVSRYDNVTGKEINISDRIGILDRKLRVINENIDNEGEWFYWVKRAYESVYGYEFQGDNLLLARENLLYTFIENMDYKFSKRPNYDELKNIARTISWNIWQMDGTTNSVPFSERPSENKQITIFEWVEDKEISDTEPIPCKIFDWRSNNSIEFNEIMKGNSKI